MEVVSQARKQVGDARDITSAAHAEHARRRGEVAGGQQKRRRRAGAAARRVKGRDRVARWVNEVG